MFETVNPGRPASKRELRLLTLLRRALPPLKHWIERARERERRLLRRGLGALPPEPRRKIGDKEWEERMAKLAEKDAIPTCLDRAELRLPDSGPTRCARTGLVLARGRCEECPRGART